MVKGTDYADMVMGDPSGGALPRRPAQPQLPPAPRVVPPYREPTLREQVDAWQALAWEINLHRTVTGNAPAGVKCLERIDAFVASHGPAPGGQSEIRKNVIAAFWEQVRAKPELGLLSVEEAKATEEEEYVEPLEPVEVAPSETTETKPPARPQIVRPQSILARKRK